MTVKQIAEARSIAGSFSAEMAKHIPALRRAARLLTRNEEAAADLTQETLAKAWAARFTFSAGTNLKAWLFTIMRNQFRSEMRRAWRQTPWDQESAERISAPRGEQYWSIELEDVARAIGTLSSRQREALILAGVGCLSSEQVGAIMGCRTTAVKSRVSRARHAIRSMLDGTVPLKKSRSEASQDTIEVLMRQLHSLTGSGSTAGAFAA